MDDELDLKNMSMGELLEFYFQRRVDAELAADEVRHRSTHGDTYIYEQDYEVEQFINRNRS